MGNHVRIAVGLFAASLLGAFSGAALAQSHAPASSGGYQTAPVMITQLGGSAIVGGTVIPFKEVTLSAQVPGRVIFLAGAEGHRAAEGEVLVQIDDADLQARRRAAVSQVYQAEAALRNSYMQYNRELYSPRVNSISGFPGMGIPATFDQFFTRGFSSAMGQSSPGLERQADLYAQGVGVDQASSGLTQAQANLESIDATLNDFRASAAFDGIVMRKHVEVGDTVQPGMPLIDFAFIDYLRIEADVPVRLAAGLSEGMLVPARLDSGGGPVEARVAQIYPVADPKRHTVTVKFDLPLGTRGGPGMYAEVTVPDASVPTQAQTSVPAEALVWRGSLPSVFVLENGAPSLRVVRVGYPLADGSISVVSGLSGGETVILSPPSSLVSGH
ncbi:efflux RND transporter periplasmic adaptor subunit [Sinisalibacter aestuarii]|uniref:RND transporter n=1 Tax=Sinisalibacter aestuarii TaxID=2949426 RepID=A0ABQ5LR58_9RHOB|nr:efflux RND transporter periplasmic adaptor subunit [Sinisalibacter aestuarii]GKY87492.1 RND transporter [Sinisalibacter aestuarii]